MNKAEELINRYIGSKDSGTRLGGESTYDAAISDLSLDIVQEAKLNEQLVKMIWKKLPSSLKSKIDIKKLEDILQSFEAGEDTSDVTRKMKLSPAVASELMLAIEKSGLL